MKRFEQSVIDTLKGGGIGVIPTDTIYGIVGRAEIPTAVERIYEIRKRDHTKACVVLISSYEDLINFNVVLSSSEKDFIEMNRLWPGKVSIILPVLDPRFAYLTRGTNSLAFRIPDVIELRELLAQTGPLIAPSANHEGLPPATTIAEAQTIFGDTIDFYVDGDEIHGTYSTIIKLLEGTFTVIREGAVPIPKNLSIS